MNSLQIQIQKRIKEKNLSVRGLETRAGLSLGVVRNILSGGSKNPTFKTLEAISQALGCLVDDLIHPEPPEEVFSASLPKQIYAWEADIFLQSFSVVKDYIEAHNLTLPAKKVFDVIWALYTLSLSKGSKTVDKDLCTWVFSQVLD